MKIEDYNKVFDLDVKAVVDMTIQSLMLLKENGENIINMSSVRVTHVITEISMVY